jgi:hypothetical protein
MNERGGAGLKMLLTLLILGALVFAAVKIIPPYFANFQLQDSMQTEARFALVNRKGEDDMRDDVWKKMQELGITARKEEIKVSVVGASVTISVDYSVPIDLKAFQFSLQFHPHADNHTI